MQNKRIIELAKIRGIDPHVKTWKDIVLILEDEFGEHAYSMRHAQRIYRAYLDEVYKVDTLRDIKSERQQLADVNREYNASIREEARLRSLYEVVENGLKDLEPIPYTPIKYNAEDKYMVVSCSDWHLGAKYSNYLGEYNYDIAKDRIFRFLTVVVEKIKETKPREVLILNLNDLIEGNIHVSTRIQAEFDAVQQTILAGELLSQFISEVANHAEVVKVGQVLDNHSRINKNKKEHIEAESFGKIVEYIVSLRVSSPNVRYVGNPVDDNIGLTQLGGKRIAWVHGHLDTPANVKSKLTELLGVHIDYVFIAHRHHIHIKDNVIQVGSLKGTDEYAFDKRLFERPSQTIVTYDDHHLGIDLVYV